VYLQLSINFVEPQQRLKSLHQLVMLAGKTVMNASNYQLPMVAREHLKFLAAQTAPIV
jgi:hypothetical protein